MLIKEFWNTYCPHTSYALSTHSLRNYGICSALGEEYAATFGRRKIFVREKIIIKQLVVRPIACTAKFSKLEVAYGKEMNSQLSGNSYTDIQKHSFLTIKIASN
jgi:hypothetical protein